jgi:hypothetical protein
VATSTGPPFCEYMTTSRHHRCLHLHTFYILHSHSTHLSQSVLDTAMAAFPKTSPTEVKTASMLATRHSGLQKLAMTLHDFGNTPIADNRADHSHRITPSDGEVPQWSYGRLVHFLSHLQPPMLRLLHCGRELDLQAPSVAAYPSIALIDSI